MANGRGKFDIYHYASRLAARLPHTRHFVPPLDAAVARLTGGRRTLTSLLTGLPVVQLTTTGARSGKPRLAILVGVPHGEGIALIGSNWGQKKNPAWVYNLRANPRALLGRGGQPAQPYTARETTGDEREALWRKAVALYPGYARYAQSAAPRTIPVLLLSPAAKLE